MTMEVGFADYRKLIVSLLRKLDLVELAEVYALAKSRAAYRNNSRGQRACDKCGTLYRGPGVYCSHRCALADR